MITSEAMDCLIVKEEGATTYYFLNRQLVYSYTANEKISLSHGKWMTAENNTVLYQFPEDKENQWRTVTQEEANQVFSWLADLELFEKKK